MWVMDACILIGFCVGVGNFWTVILLVSKTVLSLQLIVMEVLIFILILSVLLVYLRLMVKLF